MANLYGDPGHETGSGHVYGGLAERSTDQARSGSYSAKLRSTSDFGSSSNSTVSRAGIAVVADQSHRLAFWFYLDAGNLAVDLVLEWRPTGGSWAELARRDATEPLATWTRVVLDFTPTAAEIELRWTSEDPGAGGLVVARWYVDDVLLEEVAMITAALRAALILDLEDVDGTGSFSTTLKQVYSNPPAAQKILYPSAVVAIGEGGSSETRSVSGNVRNAFQDFEVELLVKESGYDEAVADLLDDVRNACERSASNLYGVALANSYKVLDVEVSAWDRPQEGDEASTHEEAAYQATVSVQYEYTRGSA